MQANQRVYCLAAVGRLLLSDCCGAMRDLPLSKRPERAILDSQPPGIGGMSAKLRSHLVYPVPSADSWACTDLHFVTPPYYGHRAALSREAQRHETNEGGPDAIEF
jgi:hypothetical protein